MTGPGPRPFGGFLALIVALGLTAVSCSNDSNPDEVTEQAESSADDGAAATGVESDSESGADGDRGAGEDDDAAPEDDSAVDGEDDAATPPPAGPKTLVWAHDVEPPDLHLDDPVNRLPITSWIREGLLESLFGVDVNLEHYPELLAAEPTVTANENRSVVIEYRLRDGLRWSDGEPLTSADVAYTHEILTEGCTTEPDGSLLDGINEGCVYAMADRRGLDLVTDFEVVSDTRFTVTMAAFYPDWRSLYRHIYAAHAYGADAAAVNRNLRTMQSESATLPTSGPLVFESWRRGVSMTLVRNDNYHGSVSPDATNPGLPSVDEVRIQFVPTPQVLVDVLAAGSAHLVMTTAKAEFEPLVGSEDFEVSATRGSLWEHWGFNVLNRHLAKPQVRLAIALAIDKEELSRDVFGALYGPVADELVLGNAYWLTSQAPYVDHQAELNAADPAQAAAVLEEAGYVRGSDRVFRHPVDGRLTLRAGTTGGNLLREREQAVLQDQLADAGIEIEIDNVAGGLYFRERPFAPEALAAAASDGAEGDTTVWDITQFARAGGAWPGGQSGAFRSGVASNPYGFGNPEFDTLASECDATVDDAERADCYNRLDLYVTTLDAGEDGLFVVPLGQRPSFTGFVPSRLSAVGAAPDTVAGGPLVNVVDYERR